MSNSNLIIGTIAVLALVLAGYGLVGGNNQSTPSQQLAGRTSDNWVIDGNLSVGTTSTSNLAHFENDSATSTAVISSGGSAVGGRIILEDHDGAGCSEIAILNGTVAAKSVTCPSGI